MTCTRISLALSGGGARGVAHLGVIEGLLDTGFTVERIVGVSIGSLAGALYAFDPDICRVQQQILEYLHSPGFQQYQQGMIASQAWDDTDGKKSRRSRWNRLMSFLRASYVCQHVVLHPSILPGDVLRHAVDHLLPEADIADARIPLSIVAVDLLAGERVVLERGPLRDAVRASSSIPGIFPPVQFEGMRLCDIGALNSLPILAMRNYDADCVVAVDVSSALEPLHQCDTAVDVLVRMNDIGENLFRGHVAGIADVVIRPNLAGVSRFDFSSPERLIEAGNTAARTALPAFRTTRCCSPMP